MQGDGDSYPFVEIAGVPEIQPRRLQYENNGIENKAPRLAQHGRLVNGDS
jgi:hypothetical protein